MFTKEQYQTIAKNLFNTDEQIRLVSNGIAQELRQIVLDSALNEAFGINASIPSNEQEVQEVKTETTQTSDKLTKVKFVASMGKDSYIDLEKSNTKSRKALKEFYENLTGSKVEELKEKKTISGICVSPYKAFGKATVRGFIKDEQEAIKALNQGGLSL
jgi:hypothetical protein